jgi:hypothetical protein
MAGFPKFSEWLELKEQDGKPKSPHGMTKIGREEVKSPGTRDARKDLSADYKGNISHNGTVEPFQVKKGKGGKTAAQVAK